MTARPILFTLYIRMTTDELAMIQEPGEDLAANVADLLAASAITPLGYDWEYALHAATVGGGHELEERIVGDAS